MRLSRVLASLLHLFPALALAGQLSFQAESVAKGVTRLWPQGADREAPSFALQAPLRGLALAEAPRVLKPAFASSGKRHSAIFALPADWDLYGTGEVAGSLRRNGTVIEAWNTDHFGYGEASTPLYQSHPWVLALAKDGSALGLLADTPYRTRIDLRSGVRFDSEGPAFPVYVIEGATPQAVLSSLAALSGHMPLPPKWALGYQQCRYSYFPEAKVREIAKGFRDRKIPCDVVWMDIDYMEGFRIFTFDPKHFPDPATLNADLHGQGFHTVWMIDPGIKAEPGYFVYDEGTRRDAWVKTASGQPFLGKVWPGDCVFPDYTRPEVRMWWGSLYAGFLDKGVDGVWNDMNEPAVFKTASKTMPLDNRHGGYGGGDHARFHNVYGMHMVRATREGIQAARPDKRPFVLSRANFLGGQRYAATWTGDNTANWQHLGLSITMALNLGLSGQPFSGPDIGGFIGETDPKLFARWMGVGALLPFARAHKMNNTKPHEPWVFGPGVEATCRRAIERRYRLMPYLYTVFEEASRSGLPVARPLFFADPADPALRVEGAAFLLGSDLLVLAQTLSSTARVHALPKGDWKTLKLEAGADADLPELRVRPGAALAVGAVIQHTGQPQRKLTVYANLDAQGRAEGWLYEDVGDGYGYQSGQHLRRRFVVMKKDGKAALKVESSEGEYKDAASLELKLL